MHCTVVTAGMAACPGSWPVHQRSEGGGMPKSSRYPITELPELPGTLQRSSREARETFLRALDAVRTHGAGDQAHRIACLALKQKFEKRGDHWIAKNTAADCGGGAKADQRAARLVRPGLADHDLAHATRSMGWRS
jgi:ChaB